jgi:hypothetical protein
MSEAEIQRFRESTEQDIQERKARILARKEGLEPESPPQSNEPTHAVGFSRDGRWLFRGGDRVMCVYDWAQVPREAGAELVDPTWEIELPGDPNDHLQRSPIWAIAEEVGSPAIVFGGCGGSLYRLDLESGEMRELIKLPGEPFVTKLQMSADGSILGVTAGTLSFTEAARKRGERAWAWEVWSYSRLRGME